jgi:DnaJ like chaperone protein
LDKINLEIKFKTAVFCVIIGFVIGTIIGFADANPDDIDKTMNLGPAVGLSLIFGILGFSVVPGIIFEFSSPYSKLYMIGGSIGIAFIKLAIKVFVSDGKLSKKEFEHINSYMSKEFGDSITTPLLDYISENNKIIEDIATISKPILNIRLSERIDILYQLFSLAAADRIYNDKEEHVLKEIAKAFKIGGKRFEMLEKRVIKTKGYSAKSQQEQSNQNQSRNFHMMDQLRRMSYNPYAVLEIDQNVSNDDLKKAYRKLVKIYHPDKSMMENEETRKKDAIKILEINEAYEAIKKMRGIK